MYLHFLPLALSLLCLGPLAAQSDKCSTDFSSSTASPCGLEVVDFTVTTPDTNLIYQWTFDDPQSEIDNTSPLNADTVRGTAVTHAFTATPTAETYTVTLTAIAADGSVCGTRKTNITTRPAPKAALAIVAGDDDQNWQNCARTSSDIWRIRVDGVGASGAEHYVIDWGDGSPVYDAATPPLGEPHEYGVGTFELTYTVTDNSLECGSSTATYQVYNGTNPGVGIGAVDNSTVCLPSAFRVNFFNYEKNTEDTWYSIAISDRKDTLWYPQGSLPPSLSINFDTISCGSTTSQGSIDAFEVVITAQNACNEFVASVHPIKVGRPPIADFTAPASSGCEPVVHKFVNTSKAGIDFPDGGGCSESVETEWSISPATGWRLLEGTRLFHDSIVVEFDEGGTYEVTMTAENGCGIDTKSRTICVLSAPDSEIFVDTQEGCTAPGSPLAVNFTNASNTIGSCGAGAQYAWSVGYQPGDCGTNPGYRLIDRTPGDPSDRPSLDDRDVSLAFDSAGVYTVYLQVTNDCKVDTDSVVITVAGAPVVTIDPVPDSCFTGTFVLTPTLTVKGACLNEPGYQWQFPGGSPSSYSGKSPPAITYDEPGNYTIQLSVGNECSNGTFTESFSLIAPPELPNLSVTSPVCNGADIVSTLTGKDRKLDFFWDGPERWTSTEAEWTRGPATGAMAGDYLLTVTDAAGCTATQSHTVVVTDAAAVRIAPSPAVVCQGEALILTASGGTDYQWTGDHLDRTTGASVTFRYDVIGEYEVTVQGGDPGGECDGTDAIMVRVVGPPEVDAGPLRQGCVSQPFDFQPLASPATGTGVWSGDHITAEGIFTVNTPGTYTVTYTYTDENGCTASDDASICISLPPQADYLLATNSVCLGDDYTFRPRTITPPDESCAAATYDWSVEYTGNDCQSAPGQAIFLEGTSSASEAPVFRLDQTGTYVLTLRLTNGCTTATHAETIVVADRPQLALAPVPDGCGAQSITFRPSVAECGTAPTTYLWEFPSASPPQTAVVADPGAVAFGPGDHTVKLTVTNACGTATVTRSFRLLEAPAPDLQLDNTFLCSAGTVGVINNSRGDELTYSWSASPADGVSFSSTTAAAPGITFSGAPGDYRVTATISNDICGTETFSETVTVSAPPTVTVAALPDACEQTTIYPTVEYGLPAAFIDSIHWTVTQLGGAAGETIYAGKETKQGIAIDAPGEYLFTATAFNGCAVEGVSASTGFEVLEGTVIDVAMDTDFLCSGETLQPSNTSTGKGLSYAWSAEPSGGLTFSDAGAAAPRITAVGPPGEYTVRLTAENAVCGLSQWDTLITLAAPPEVSIEPIPDYCGTARVDLVGVYSDTDAIDSVRWTITDATGKELFTSTSFSPASPPLGVGRYAVRAVVYNACGTDEAIRSFRVYGEPKPDLRLSATALCLDEATTVTVENVTTGDALTYAWTVAPAAEVSNTRAPSPTFTFREAGTYAVSVRIESPVCDPVEWTRTVNVEQKPGVSLASIADACGEARINPQATFTHLDGADGVEWYFPGHPEATASGPTPGERLYDRPGTYTVGVVIYNECGRDSAEQTFRVLEPITASAELTQQLGCERPFTATVENTSRGSDLNYRWSVTGPDAGRVQYDATAASPTFTFPDTGQYVVRLRAFNEICGEDFWEDTVRVLLPPTVTLSARQARFCERASLDPVVDYGGYQIDSVVWSFPGSDLPAASSRERFPTGVPYSRVGTYPYSVTVYNACGTHTATATIVIDAVPVVTAGPVDTVCLQQGLVELPSGSPAGGRWRDSLGRPGVVTAEGLFDPARAGEGTAVLEYVVQSGACEGTASQYVQVVDRAPAVVRSGNVDVCVSEEAFLLDVGSPAGGWYTGPGVTDARGVFDATELGIGNYELTYHYRTPGTDCTSSKDFRVRVRPLPAPAIAVTDSLCIDATVSLRAAGKGGDSWEWSIAEATYSGEQIEHAFGEVGQQTVSMTATSAYGCVASTEREVYVSAPPVADFTKDKEWECALQPINLRNRSQGFRHVRYHWDFGNGGSSTEEHPPTIRYEEGMADSTYYVALTATNACGEDTHVDSLDVTSRPIAYMDLSQREGCSSLEVEFVNVTSGTPDRFSWYIDGAFYSADSIPPNYTFTTGEDVNTTYAITLIAANECAADTFTRELTVHPDDLRAFFSPSAQIGCTPFTVEFQNFSSPDTLMTFDWFFADGSSSREADPVHTFINGTDEPLVREVMLVADNGCTTDSITVPITINPAPAVRFSVAPVVCMGDSVQFTNLSNNTSNPVWHFGNGDSLTRVQHPVYKYTHPGTYAVDLRAFDVGTGCAASWTEEVTVRDLPVAAAAAGPLFGCPPLEVKLENASTSADYYSWDFGDGNTRVGADPGQHTYKLPGTHAITLTATDRFGCSHDSVVARARVYEVPKLDIVATAGDECGLPTRVCFKNVAADLPDDPNAADYRWDFGGGRTSVENEPCLPYGTAGDHPVTVLMTNTFGCSSGTTFTHTVRGRPLAAFSYADTAVCERTTVNFTNTSQDATWANWAFTDGSTSTDYNSSMEFTRSGTFGATLVVGDDNFCTDTLHTEAFIRVEPSPTADFDYFDRADLPATTIEFTNLSSADIVQSTWDFGDGRSSTEEHPVHRYVSSFDKTVWLWVENENGCRDSLSTVVDLDTLGSLYIPNAFTPDDASVVEQNIFRPKGIGLGDYYIAVYTRNGQLVWESDLLDEEGAPTESWDGTFRGRRMPAGTYVWRVHRASYLNGRPWAGMADEGGTPRQSGFVSLMR